jgi:ParB-like chromosome segregation protein Spo0J
MEKEIPVENILPHPENSNYMPPVLFKKLVRHIKNTGRYEPITVRPHPEESGKFQLINGHNRLNALKELGRDNARCTVWKLSDAEARLYLATLNRLSGKEVPERRELLLDALAKDFTQEDLTGLLPDPTEHIEALFRQEEEIAKMISNFEKKEDIPAMLSFYLDRAKAETVEKALDLVKKSNSDILSSSDAIWAIADFYLKNKSAD